MAGRNVIKLELNTVVNGEGNVVNITNELRNLQQALAEVDKVKQNALNFAALNKVIGDIGSVVASVSSEIDSLAAAYAVQEEAERKLTVVMRERMAATDEQIDKIKELASAQQQIGIIGDELQLSGAQQLATFLNETDSLETLLPAMNNLVAQQKGLNATQQDCVNIANLFGKAMQGQTSALKRVGITFDDTQKAILETGNEQERAAMLAEVVTQNVGHMNQELANTPSGKMKQLANNLGDIKEQIGRLATGAQPFVTFASQATIATGGVLKLINAVKALQVSMRAAFIGSGIIAAISAIAGVIYTLTTRTSEAAKATEQAKKEMKDFKKSVSDVSQGTARYAAEEFTKLNQLYNVAKDETKSRKERLAALAELKKSYPEYFGQISNELSSVKNLNIAYETLKNNIIEVARARAINDKLAENQGTLLELEDNKDDLAGRVKKIDELLDLYRAFRDAGTADAKESTGRAFNARAAEYGYQKRVGTGLFDNNQPVFDDLSEQQKNLLSAYYDTESKIQAIYDANNGLQSKLSDIQINVPEITAPDPDGTKPLTLPTEFAHLEDFDDAIKYYQEKQKKATKEEYQAYKAKIEEVKRLKAEFMGETMSPVEPTLPESYNNITDFDKGVDYYRQKQKTADSETYQLYEAEIKKIEDLKAAFMGLPTAAEKAAKEAADAAEKAAQATKEALDRQISPLQETADMLKSLTGRDYKLKVEGIGFDRIQETLREINKLLSDPNLTDEQRTQLEGLKSKYKEFSADSVNSFGELRKAWGSIGTMEAGLNTITKAVEEHAGAWSTVKGVIDGALQIYDGISAIIPMLNALSTAKQAETAATEVNTAATTANANAKVTDAAAGFFAAHSWIPWVGVGIAAASVALMLAQMTGLIKFADGGIAYGPTLGLFGEYQGARNNPEVVAPLSKLRSMLDTDGVGGHVEFQIKGETLVGVLNRRNRHVNRS